MTSRYELVTERDMRDAHFLMRQGAIDHIEGADEFVHDVAQFIANGRRESMENREGELKRKIFEAQQWYQRIIEPWIKELSEIKLCKPPSPVMMTDGRIATYVGPLPTWEPDGLCMDQFAKGPEARKETR